MNQVDNAVIMAAGTASRFAPLSYERPKALIEVRGEVLIERQIRQLKEAGIDDIYIVTGYKADSFAYLGKKFGVKFRHNPTFATRNNNASIRAVEDVLNNSYVCSADNYFTENPFESAVEDAYYAAVYSDGPTAEWCMQTDDKGWIRQVAIGGSNSWYMLGHTFWDSRFSRTFTRILDDIYDAPETANKLWENIYIEHIDALHMKMRKYPEGVIYEFDTLDELRQFDPSYVENTRSAILKQITAKLQVREADLHDIRTIKDHSNEAVGFRFRVRNQGNEPKYQYIYKTAALTLES